jgi:hypothetical protein
MGRSHEIPSSLHPQWALEPGIQKKLNNWLSVGPSVCPLGHHEICASHQVQAGQGLQSWEGPQVKINSCPIAG